MTMMTEDRTGRLEGAYEQVADRLNAIQGELLSIRERIDAQGREFNERLDAQSREFNERLDAQSREFNERLDASVRELRQDIRNLMIAMIALWGTTIAGVIAILVVVLIQ